MPSAGGRAEFAHFISIAIGSLGELRTYLELARRFEYLSPEQHSQLVSLAAEVHRLACGLRKSLSVRE